MTKMQRSIAAIVLAAATGLCAAQGPAASPAKKELVQKVLQLQRPGLEHIGTTLAGQMSTRVLQMTAPAVARVAADKREALANEIKEEVKKFFEDSAAVMREQAVRVAPGTLGAALEERFNEEELKSLVAWLESPVSRKYQQVAVEMQQSLAQKIVADTRPAIEPRLKALEKTVSKKLSDAGVKVTTDKASAPKK